MKKLIVFDSDDGLDWPNADIDSLLAAGLIGEGEFAVFRDLGSFDEVVEKVRESSATQLLVIGEVFACALFERGRLGEVLSLRETKSRLKVSVASYPDGDLPDGVRAVSDGPTVRTQLDPEPYSLGAVFRKTFRA